MRERFEMGPRHRATNANGSPCLLDASGWTRFPTRLSMSLSLSLSPTNILKTRLYSSPISLSTKASKRHTYDCQRNMVAYSYQERRYGPCLFSLHHFISIGENCFERQRQTISRRKVENIIWWGVKKVPWWHRGRSGAKRNSHLSHWMWVVFFLPSKLCGSLKLSFQGKLIHGLRLAGSRLFEPLARNEEQTGTMSDMSHD